MINRVGWKKHGNYTMYIVNISGEDYYKVEKFSSKWSSNSKKSKYGRGILNSKNNSNNVARTGALLELAFSNLVGQEPDLEFKNRGDSGYDLVVNGYTVDCKCSSRLRNNMISYVKIIENSKTTPFKADYALVGVKIEDYIKEKFAKIGIYGVFSKEYIDSLPLKNSPIRGYSHKNKELHWNDAILLSNCLKKI